jgi:serine/threonine-protein kinase
VGLTDTEAPTSVLKTIGRYTLLGEIASGGMATVHLGSLTGPGGFSRTVAIKRLHAQFAREPEFVEKFLDEARLAARIVHPNVVPTLDVVSSDGELFLVMEYVRGLALAHIVRALKPSGGRIPLPIGMSIVQGLLHGLQAAHEATDDRGAPLGIVHRDVSPQNVLVGVDGAARVLDFGVAKAVGRLQTTRDGRLKGKLAYMAPEQLSDGRITPRTDLYAAAIVMWEVVTGKRLFKADTDAAVLNQVLTGEVNPPSREVGGLPRAVDAIVMRGLQRDPENRFASAREMADAIAAGLEIAPSPQVGDWLKAAAAGPLQERIERVEGIERAAREGVTVIQSRTVRLDEVEAGGASVGPSVSSASVEPPRRRLRAGALVGVLVAGAALVIVLTGPRLTRQTDPQSAATVAPPFGPTISTSAPDPAPPPAPSASSGPAPSASTPPVAKPAPVGRTARPVVTPPPPASTRACAPYVIDAKGHKVFNAACL